MSKKMKKYKTFVLDGFNLDGSRRSFSKHEDINALLKLLPTAPIKYQLSTLLALTLGPKYGEVTAVRCKL